MPFPILDLPTEVIAHIFSFVSQKKDRRNLALLCKKLLKIVRYQSKKRNHLNLWKFIRNYPSLLIFEHNDEFPFQRVSLCAADIGEFKDLWRRHGAEITQMSLACELNELERLGRDLKELFPNLKSLFPNPELILRQNTFPLGEKKDPFSDKIEHLCLTFPNGCFKQLDIILELFPGLKRLTLELSVLGQQCSKVQEQKLKDLLDKWLSKLEKVQLSFRYSGALFNLVKAFDGLTNEKLSFGSISVLYPENLNIVKSFFSRTRYIEELHLALVTTALDSGLCALINQNATVYRLITYSDQLARLLNVRGVKEIIVLGIDEVSSFTGIPFTQECLLKVKEIDVSGKSDGSVFRIPLFRNLRTLALHNFTIDNEELEFIANNFPFLEDLRINSNLHATNGHAMTNLKHLRSLEISFSPRLFDHFFDFGAILPDLESLRITNVPNVSIVGVKSIVKNCPNIQTIVLEIYNETTEECINLFAQKLFYVKKLKLGSENRSALSLRKKY